MCLRRTFAEITVIIDNASECTILFFLSLTTFHNGFNYMESAWFYKGEIVFNDETRIFLEQPAFRTHQNLSDELWEQCVEIILFW